MKKLSTEEYIKRCVRKHGNKYNYDATIYYGDKKNVLVKCIIHGEFNQRSDHHMNGHGCNKCATMRTGDALRTSLNQFIDAANAVHSNKFDYSEAIYKTARVNLTVICPIHGHFKVTPDSHLNGTDCMKCSIVANAIKQRGDISLVLLKANAMHYNKYDYSNVVYTNYKTKVEIICPKHGSFYQNMSNHTSGKGCPECNMYSGNEKYISKLLKYNNVKFIAQKTFPDLMNEKTKKHYRFDFYIHSMNTIIEYDGKHHFENITIWSGHDYLKVRRVDTIKTQYCLENNINLIRISYKDKILDTLMVHGVIQSNIPNHMVM